MLKCYVKRKKCIMAEESFNVFVCIFAQNHHMFCYHMMVLDAPNCSERQMSSRNKIGLQRSMNGPKTPENAHLSIQIKPDSP